MRNTRTNLLNGLEYERHPFSHLRKIWLIGFLIGIQGLGFGQTLNLQKSVSQTTPNVGDAFTYIIDASCNSTTRDCESVVFTDPLPSSLEFLNFSDPLPDGIGSASYDEASHTVTITFDASACTCLLYTSPSPRDA